MSNEEKTPEKSDNDKPEEDKVEILKADSSLKDEIGNLLSLDKILNEQVVKKAEKKVEENVDYLRDAYENLLDHYVLYLRGAFEEMRHCDTHEEKKQCLDDMQHTALSIKSSASIFGYDIAEKFATSLYLIVPYIKKIDDRIYLLLESYIKCLEIIVNEKIMSADNHIAQELLEELNKIAEKQKFLQQ